MNNDKSKSWSSRRDFVRKAALAAAGTAVFPLIIPSCSGRRGANERIAVAHIGTGDRGTWEMKYYFLPVRDFLNVAVSDVYADRMKNAAQTIDKFYSDNNDAAPACAMINDFEELLQRDDIDAVHITTPDHWHVPAAIKAARAGKHIMLAKPLGLCYREYMVLQQEMKDKDLRFHYGTQQRTSPHMQLGYNMIREGRLGEIERVEVWCPGKNPVDNPVCTEMPVPDGFDFDRWSGPAPLRPYCPERVTNNGSWFNYDYSIGFLGGWGAHPLDILVWILREKVSGSYSCEGTGRFWEPGGLYNNIMSWDVKCLYDNGPELHFVSDDVAVKGMLDHRTMKETNGTTFYGSKGWLSLSRSSAQSDIADIDREINSFPKNEEGWIKSETNMMGKVFADVISGKIKELCPLEEAIISDTISHMGDIAVRTGRKVRWDPVRGEVVNDLEAGMLFSRQQRSPYIT